MKVGTNASLTAVAMAMALSAPVQAQDDTSASVSKSEVASADAQGTDEVVVVAQRREERLRDVPSSIATVSGAQIEATASQRVQDIANYVPNLAINAGSGLGAVLTIRGVGSSSRNIGFDSRAGLYVDGVYLGQSPALDQDLMGLARVEVLRGPQGALFGKNTVAGAVNLITQRPGKTFGGEAFTRIGNLGMRQFSVRMYGPASDTVSAGFAVSRLDRAGFITNLNDNADTPTRGSTAMRGQVNIDGGGPFTLYLAADAQLAREKRNNGDALTNALGTGPNTDAPGINVTNYTHISDDVRENWGLSGEAAYELSGGHVVKSITAYRDTDFRSSFDGERNLVDLLVVTYADRYRQTSQELQFISPGGGNVRYIAGLFFYRQAATTQRDALGGAASRVLGIVPGTGARSGGDLLTRNLAGYGNIAYDIVPQIEASIGFRWSWEKKSVDWSIDGRRAPAFGIATGRIIEDRVDRDLSPTATLTWRITPQVNLYGRYSSGYKSGGYNLDFVSAAVFPNGIEFEKETVDNYEAGLKGAFFGGRATLNLTGFIADFSNYQVNQYRDLGGGRTAISISNAGAVRTKGLELEATLRVARGLDLTGSAGLLDATFTDFADGGRGGRNLAGNRLPLASKYQASVGANYRGGLGGGFNLLASAQYSYRSAFFTEPENISSQIAGTATIPWGRVPGYDLIDARVGVTGPGGWELSLWSRNLGDRNYVSSYNREFLGTLIEYRAEPRTWGVEGRIVF